jgi:hypothetical protein
MIANGINGDGVEVSADEDGEVLDEETFQQMRIALGARILTNEPDKIAAASGLPPETPGIERAVRVSRYPKPLLLVVLTALIFGATGLHAQLVTPLASPPELSDVVRLTQPDIMCTVGRAGFIGHAGRQAATIEMVVARGVAYVALGGAILALVVSFRLLGDNVDSFFAVLIPKPNGTRDLRIIPPLDEDFSPFMLEPASELNAKQNTSRLAPGSPLEASNSPEISIPPTLEVPRLDSFPRARLTARRRFIRFSGCPSLNWKRNRGIFEVRLASSNCGIADSPNVPESEREGLLAVAQTRRNDGSNESIVETNKCLHRFDTGFVPTTNRASDYVTRNSPLISCVSKQRPGHIGSRAAASLAEVAAVKPLPMKPPSI